MDWECGQLAEAVPATGKTCRWLIPPSEFRTGYTDPTLMSTMVWVNMRQDATAAAGHLIAFGVIVWNAASDAELVGDLCPGPISDCDADWVYLFFGPNTLEAQVRNWSPTGDLDRRSQAKRRIGNDRGILLVGETVGVAGFVHAHVRCLIKE